MYIISMATCTHKKIRQESRRGQAGEKKWAVGGYAMR